jgi:acid phosphatase
MKYRADTVHGHDFGIAMLTKFRNTYLGPISDRLSDMTSNFHFSNGEVYSMQEMCGFETLARGYSPWCNIFTRDDWVNFEYARDIIHFYRAGPGNPYGPAMGWLWINATLNLLLQGQAAGPFFFSLYDLIHPSSPLFALGKADALSVHDGDIIPMLSALEVFPDRTPLPVTHVLQSRSWRTSSVTPMGGRTVIELLSCSEATDSGRNPSKYIRLNINDGAVPLTGCNDGPGGSCALSKFTERVRERGKDIGDFRTVCGLGNEMPDRITFLHQD